MQLARVKGTVVSTNKAEKLNGLKLQLIKPIDIETWQEKGGLRRHRRRRRRRGGSRDGRQRQLVAPDGRDRGQARRPEHCCHH